MLIILLIFALIRTLHGVPLSSPLDASNSYADLYIRDTQTRFGQRSVNEIIISCFATIFACTWSATHPNVPAVTDCAWTRFKRQVTIMIYALLAPEVMITGALNQRLGARAIMDEYNKVINGSKEDGRNRSFFGAIGGLFKDSEYPPTLEDGKGPQWTLTHGFFLQMGGFMLCKNGQPIQVLTAVPSSEAKETTIIWKIKDGTIDPPRISEADIQDRSKGDAISKTFVVLQTTWFVVQCIARWTQRLPVTELEVVTLGFAILNGITYALWWNKPQNVGRPVFLESKKSRRTKKGPIKSSTTSNNVSSANAGSNPLVNPRKESWLREKLRQDIKKHAYSRALLWRIPYRIFQTVLRPLRKMTGDDTITKMRVGMFYSVNHFDWGQTGLPSAAIGVLFGSVHLIPGWFLDFSSPQERWLWRVSAIIITAEPMLMVFSAYLAYFNQEFFHHVISIPMFIGLPFYLISRIILLTLSLISLGSLSPAALQTVEWTTFIPHI